ncbi:two-component system sensor histidine kinase AtoS [Desulfolucanica intricata]|uniref:two-component system sensor histidine kinase AtoS n=1 Tax=Desulfolucanica intricata TaxID=1285191 RepID=UPI000ABFDF3E|nr:two-component system sensor histidine kinase AtoS [Desulfolucanica intricata]
MKLSDVGFGNRIMIFVLLLLVLPVLLTGYMLHIIKNSELSLLEQQKATLNQAAYLFDQSINGSLQQYLESHGAANKSREEQTAILGEMVNGVINDIRKDYPNVHIGLYSKELDVYFDGSQRLNENFSLRRKKAFDETLDMRKTLTLNVGQEEGGIVEIYKPFSRGGHVEGVIRVADYLSEVGYYGKRREVETTAYAIIITVIIIGIGGALLLFRQFVAQVHNIRDGVRRLEDDLTRTLPTAPGELGEIVNAVNRFAQKIADLNLYNETMLASIDDAIIVVDIEGRVMIANNMAKKMFNLPTEFLIKHYKKLLPEGSPFVELIRRTMDEKKHFKDLQVPWVNESNNEMQLFLSTSPLMDSQGRVIGAVLTSRDITERVKLREKAQTQERLAALGKLVTGVAHEIRNPLTSISCYIQHWQDQQNPSPRALSIMNREVARLDSIVDQLLYFAKPAEAKLIKKDINSLIEDVLNFFHEVYHGKYVLIKDLQRNIPPVWIDPEQIERVVVNMLFNAIQSMPESGTITISTAHCPNETVQVSVVDTGCGIPREHLAHVFDPFYSTRPKGTGLGLAIAYEIIHVHGGHIEVESEVGRGTKFSFYLNTKEEV